MNVGIVHPLLSIPSYPLRVADYHPIRQALHEVHAGRKPARKDCSTRRRRSLRDAGRNRDTASVVLPRNNDAL
jgi:hypothetical protein